MPAGVDENGRPNDLRSFGRKRARGLSARQEALLAELLPKLSIDLSAPCADTAGLFPNPVRDVHLEIGFGGGEHLLWQARLAPDTGHIGCEPFVDGMVKVLSAIDQDRLANIQLHNDDARDVLRWLPSASIGRVYILFPDPWPKRKHAKRRLVNRSTLQLIARVMRPDAELRIATDIGDYVRTTLLAIEQSPEFHWTAITANDWRQRPQDWPATRYEAKAGREGRRCYFFKFRRVV